MFERNKLCTAFSGTCSYSKTDRDTYFYELKPNGKRLYRAMKERERERLEKQERERLQKQEKERLQKQERERLQKYNEPFE